MTKATATVVVPTPHSISKRAAFAVGEAIDGHTDLMVGWDTARHPLLIAKRAEDHKNDIEAYLAEKLAS